MIEHSNSEFNNPNNDNFIFRDLVDQVSFVFDDAFDVVPYQYQIPVQNKVIIDKKSYGRPMYSVLLTKNGQNTDGEIEKLYLFANPRNRELSIVEAANKAQNDESLVYKTEEFYIEHHFVGGEKTFSRVDKDSIHTWLPQKKYNEPLSDNSDATAILNRLDFNDYSSSITTEQIDIDYAKHLINKLDQWLITPQSE